MFVQSTLNVRTSSLRTVRTMQSQDLHPACNGICDQEQSARETTLVEQRSFCFKFIEVAVTGCMSP